MNPSAETIDNHRLLGFDEHGEVFDRETVVYRKISDGYKAQVSHLHRLYRQNGLAAKGIVETTLRDDGDLEHRRLVTSYPYEWPASMYKEAVLFHLKLFLELDKAGLTLKDGLPNNIVFDHTAPVFVDFLSLVPAGKLREEAWLGAGHYGDARFAVLEKMVMPYLILPLLFMAKGDYRTARDLLSSRSCNCSGKPPSWRELAHLPRRVSRSALRSYAGSLVTAAQIRAKSLQRGAFPEAIRRLTALVSSMDVAPPLSGYASYYDEKKEALALGDPGSFLPKQRAVHDALVARRSGSVLDIGANTGWYSHLAANLGASVIALEEDESCVDILYGRARRLGLSILPLKVSFGQLTAEIYGAPGLGAAYDERGVARHPLYRAGVDRFAADAVLVLGLIHHLVLGEGRSLDDVLQVLAKLAKKTLILEFVARDDEKIVGDPGFFPSLSKNDPSTYSLEKVLDVGRRHFSSVATRPSHPASRTILVFDK